MSYLLLVPFLLYLLHWFFEPYFVWRARRQHPLLLTLQSSSGEERQAVALSTLQLQRPPLLALSLIIPAFNECRRIPSMLQTHISFFEAKKRSCQSFSYEILVVDDGSTDNT